LVFIATEVVELHISLDRRDFEWTFW